MLDQYSLSWYGTGSPCPLLLLLNCPASPPGPGLLLLESIEHTTGLSSYKPFMCPLKREKLSRT